MRGFGARRALRFAPTSTPLFLPLSGPFSNLAPVLINTLSDQTYSSSLTINSTRTNPIMAKTLTVNVGVNLKSTDFKMYFWCDTFILNGNLDLRGGDGSFGNVDVIGCSVITIGGDGGTGISGGGGGGSDGNSCGAYFGGNGGSNGDGLPGTADCGNVPGNAGGGNPLSDGSPWTYPTGGSGGDTDCGATLGGSGGSGFGGGGGGGNAFGHPGAGGGAGGGGGLVNVVANKIIIGTGRVFVNGGAGGQGSDDIGATGTSGAGGGAGDANLFAIQYDGKLHLSALGGFGPSGRPGNDGSALMYELSHAGVILASHPQGASWNHL